MLFQRFSFGHLVTAVQDLIEQSQHLAVRGPDGNHILADVTTMRSLADLTKVFRQRLKRRVVKFGCIMEDQHGLVFLGDPFESVRSHRCDDRLVRHMPRRTQAVQCLQVVGRTEFVRQSAARMSTHLVERRRQPSGASSVSQFCVPKHRLTQTHCRRVTGSHGRLRQKGVQCRTSSPRPTHLPSLSIDAMSPLKKLQSSSTRPKSSSHNTMTTLARTNSLPRDCKNHQKIRG